MDYLFGSRVAVTAPLKLTEDIIDDTALLSKPAWTTLFPVTPPTDCAAVSITPLNPPQSLLASGAQIPPFLTWCRLEATSVGLTIPQGWSEEHPQVFPPEVTGNGRDTHSITAVDLIPLTGVVLSALSHRAYHAAALNTASLVTWLCGSRRILRQGTVYSIPSDIFGVASTELLQFKLVMSEPVLQGFLEQGITSVSLVAGGSLAPAAGSAVERHADASEQEGFEIDENFLGNSVLSSSSQLRLLAHDNIRSESKDWALSMTMLPLPCPVSALWDSFSAYVRTNDLSKIGILDGDWAVVQCAQTSCYRLIRVAVNDSIVNMSGTVLVSPVLLHNILRGTFISAPVTVRILPSPFASRLPVIPVARSVTIARVASPTSTHRSYQHALVHALKEHLRRPTHVVKQGDIIALAIDMDQARIAWELDGLREVLPDSEAGIKPCLPGPFHNPNEVVYFVITNIEHDVLPTHNGETTDVYMGSAVGELGCRIDHTVTRILQAGVEHSRAPGIAGCPGTSFLRARIGQRNMSGKLLALSTAALARNAVEYRLQLTVLLKGPRGSGKMSIASEVAEQLGLHLFEINCYDVMGETAVHTEAVFTSRFEKAAACSPCVLVLRHLDALRQTTQNQEPDRDSAATGVLIECLEGLRQSWTLTGYPVLVFATTENPERLPTHILSAFKHELTIDTPDEKERLATLQSLLAGTILAPDVSLAELAVQTAALVPGDLVDLVSRAKRAAILRATRVHDDVGINIHLPGLSLTAADFDLALADSRASYSESIGAPKIPAVSWDDVGGLAHVKADILDTIQLPLQHPELFSTGLKKRSGILLYGPPGTGKTLLAKAVATSCALNFFSVKGPELLNMYIGESEANVRRVFQRARDAKPCVIFFDELDSVAPKRGNQGDSGGVMDRIVSQLLAELDGMSEGSTSTDVFVIGATNRPDLLDPALLRPGRFDRMLYLGVSDTHEAQLHILQALTRKFKLHPDLDLRRIAEACPFHYTGADFYALCADALLKAMSRKAAELEIKIANLNSSPRDLGNQPYPLTPQYYLAELAMPDDIEVLVTTEDFEQALHELVPSVSQAEMEHYARVQEQFSRETINSSRSAHDEEVER